MTDQKILTILNENSQQSIHLFARQYRIEERIFQTISEESSIENVTPIRRKRKNLCVFLAAAIMALALSITALASIHNEWDIALIQFMGIQDSNTLQLESGEVQMNVPAYYQPKESASVFLGLSPIQMTVVSSIGDKNSAYIHIKTAFHFSFRKWTWCYLHLLCRRRKIRVSDFHYKL